MSRRQLRAVDALTAGKTGSGPGGEVTNSCSCREYNP